MTQRAVNRKGWGTRDTDLDIKVSVSADDTTPDFLLPKLVAGTNITLTEQNPGGNENILIDAAVDGNELVAVSADDTTPNFLLPKLVAGTNITLTEQNPGGNENIKIDAAGGGGIPDASAVPSWLRAGSWDVDSGNTQLFQTLEFGTIAGSDRGVYRVYPFTDAIVGDDQFLSNVVTPPIGWTSTKLKFRLHFIVQDTIVLPGVFKFDLDCARQQNIGDVSPTKTQATVTYTLAGTLQPRYRITALSSEVTIASATDAEAIYLQLTRDTSVTNDESDEAFFVGLQIIWSD